MNARQIYLENLKTLGECETKICYYYLINNRKYIKKLRINLSNNTAIAVKNINLMEQTEKEFDFVSWLNT